jgi:hypothetical protein
MTDAEKAVYKEQVFGNGQPSTHTPTPPPTNEPPVDAKLTASNIAEPSIVKSDTPPSTPVANDDEEIVDAEPYIAGLIKENLGVETWDDAKAAIAELTQLREAAKTPAEIKFANDQSKQLHEAILAGENDKVYEILDTQRKIAAIDTMKPADSIKLHIQLANKSFKPIDVEDVFEEKYSYPEKPVKDDLEEDADFKIKEDKWKAAKEKIDRRIERDAATAKSELTKLSAELKLPEIQKPNVSEPANNVETEKERLKAEKEATEFYSKLSTKDIQMVFKFNDEANKLAFDIAYEPDKESLDIAKSIALDPQKFWEDYYEKDGSPKRTEFLKDLYVRKNLNKIVTEAVVVAVNQERLRALKYQKNIGDYTQRNYVQPPVSEVDVLRNAVFGK